MYVYTLTHTYNTPQAYKVKRQLGEISVTFKTKKLLSFFYNTFTQINEK